VRVFHNSKAVTASRRSESHVNPLDGELANHDYPTDDDRQHIPCQDPKCIFGADEIGAGQDVRSEDDVEDDEDGEKPGKERKALAFGDDYILQPFFGPLGPHVEFSPRVPLQYIVSPRDGGPLDGSHHCLGR